MTFNVLSLLLDLAANIPLAKHYEKLQYHQKSHHLNTMTLDKEKNQHKKAQLTNKKPFV